jgi:hypothetical protein
MFLIINNKEYEIPVLPEKLSIQTAGKNDKTTVIGLGEINILRQKGLREVSWESLFPAHLAPYVTAGKPMAPMEYVKAIQEVRDAEEPIIFLIIGADLDINIRFGIDSFDYEERGREVGDIYYEIKLTEWKDYSPKRIIMPPAPTKPAQVKAPARPGKPAAAKTHTVVKGDCLWVIARKYYGNGSRYPEIYNANKTIIDKRNKGTGNPKYTIYPGQVFIIP